jgi:hypothetical protein
MKKRMALMAAGTALAACLPLSVFAAYGTYGYGTPYAYNVPFSPYSTSPYYSYTPYYYTPYYPMYGYGYGYGYGYQMYSYNYGPMMYMNAGGWRY